MYFGIAAAAAGLSIAYIVALVKSVPTAPRLWIQPEEETSSRSIPKETSSKAG